MDIFDVLSLIGGLSLFLFGMNVMGTALEKRAGNSLTTLLSRLTTGKLAGFLTGLGVTSVIQSSSATTVMVVGFVNSGIMTLRQAINIIMGANVGTTITAWILSLAGIESSNLFVSLLKPTSFTPVLALIGIALQMFGKDSKKKDTGLILLGFATLMFGMDTMSDSVAGLKDVPAFGNILVMFSNPILGVLAGAVLTGIIQSSSASVGILQALASTGQVTIGTSIPVIMGQNIGTCVTAMLSSVGTNRNARRTAIVHLNFNIIGTVVLLALFCAANYLFKFAFVADTASEVSIAIVHTIFNVLCTVVMLPAAGLLEKLAYRIIPEPPAAEDRTELLDPRLLATPSVALERCRAVTEEMAHLASSALKSSLTLFSQYDYDAGTDIRRKENDADRYEDAIGTYLIKLSNRPLSKRDNAESAKLLHAIGDFERISDHAVGILGSIEELNTKGIQFTPAAQDELSIVTKAVSEIVDISMTAFLNSNVEAAGKVEPLEQVIDTLIEQLRTRHILRMQKNICSIEAGFIWSDILANLKRVADHCSNIAGCVIELTRDSLELHGYLGEIKAGSPEFIETYNNYAEKYALIN